LKPPFSQTEIMKFFALALEAALFISRHPASRREVLARSDRCLRASMARGCDHAQDAPESGADRSAPLFLHR
jgi:hypothetical protein